MLVLALDYIALSLALSVIAFIITLSFTCCSFSTVVATRTWYGLVTQLVCLVDVIHQRQNRTCDQQSSSASTLICTKVTIGLSVVRCCDRSCCVSRSLTAKSLFRAGHHPVYPSTPVSSTASTAAPTPAISRSSTYFDSALTALTFIIMMCIVVGIDSMCRRPSPMLCFLGDET